MNEIYLMVKDIFFFLSESMRIYNFICQRGLSENLVRALLNRSVWLREASRRVDGKGYTLSFT
ncbi:hypothetical protein GCM10028819_30650 [Spirosoma humi]